MLPKAKRFNLGKNNLNWRQLQWTTTPFFSFSYTSSELELTQVGIIVSKKVSKKAVVRNQLKRLIFQQINQVFNLNLPGRILLIRLSPSMIQAKPIQIKTQLENLKAKFNL